MDRETVIATVQKLLNVTVDRGATPAEQENAAAAAQRLLLKFGLSMQEVGSAVNEAFIEGHVHLSSARVPSWIATLSSSIARFFTVEVFQVRRPINKESSQLAFVGDHVGVKLATWLFDKVKRDIYAGCLRELSTVKVMPRKERNAWQKSFFEAAALAVHKRLYEARQNARRENANANALIVQNERAICQHVAEKYGPLSNAKVQKPGVDSAEGLIAGYRLGSEISIATNALEADPRKQLQAN
jgi:hypothetical protein